HDVEILWGKAQDGEEVDKLGLCARNAGGDPERAATIVEDEDLSCLVHGGVHGTDRLAVGQGLRSDEDLVVARAGLIEMEWPGALDEGLWEELRAPGEPG